MEEFFGSEAGLSAPVISRLVKKWQEEHKAFQSRDLTDRDYVYVWADGVHFTVRLGGDDRLCCLVLMGVRLDGTKELIAITEGYRESTDSWAELLRDCRRRGMRAPVLAIGDGALGFWAAVRDVVPETRHQRDWVHETANVLDALPKSVHPQAKRLIREITHAENKQAASLAVDALAAELGVKWPKATDKITRDREAFLAFYDFPAEHWKHLRTTNAIESTFAPVRARTDITKGPGSRAAGLAMVFKLIEAAEGRPRKGGGGRSPVTSKWRWCAPEPHSSTGGWSSEPKRTPRDHPRSTTFDNFSDGVSVPTSCDNVPVFDQVRNYQAAYLGKFPTYSEDARTALTWASERAAEHSCDLTIVVPTRRHFRDDPVLSALPHSVQRETPQTLGHYPKVQPVVVMFWPGEKDVERLERSAAIEALVVVPWLEEDIKTWRVARGAVDLLGRHETPEAPALSDPVVEAAMRSLSLMVNLSTGLGHPRDRSMAIHAFRILKRNGHYYEPDEIHAWAMAHGWAADDARNLSEYAAGVLAGKRYQAGSSGWNAQIIRQWRSQAQGD